MMMSLLPSFPPVLGDTFAVLLDPLFDVHQLQVTNSFHLYKFNVIPYSSGKVMGVGILEVLYVVV